MGYVPPPPPLRLNLDRFGMPRDFYSYMWLVYGRRVVDNSPARQAFLHGPRAKGPVLDLGQQLCMR